MQFRRLVVESYKKEIVLKLQKKGYSAEEAEKYVDACIENPIEILVAEILREEKQLDESEITSFLRMIQKAKGVEHLMQKSAHRTQGEQSLEINGREILFPERELTKKISSQLIQDKIDVKIAQHQLEIVKIILGTTPRIIVDLDKIPYINEIRFDVRDFKSNSNKLTNQFCINPLTHGENEYTGIVEILIDTQLYGEAKYRAEIAQIEAKKQEEANGEV